MDRQDEFAFVEGFAIRHEELERRMRETAAIEMFARARKTVVTPGCEDRWIAEMVKEFGSACPRA